MADYFYKDGKKYYKNQSHSNDQKNNCFIETHTIAGSAENENGNIPVSVFLETTAPQTVFEDFTNNHNKTLIQLFVVGMSAPVQVTILTRNRAYQLLLHYNLFKQKYFKLKIFKVLLLQSRKVLLV